MKKVTAILFLSIYLLSATGINELFKVNVLIQHFHETQKKDSTVTFIHFLVMHYMTDDLNSKDDDRDKQLPFKSPETSPAGNPFVYFSAQGITSPCLPSFPVNKEEYRVIKNTFPLANYNKLVWHPPKYS